MAQFKDETRQYHLERVREALVLAPRGSLRDICELLQGAKVPLVLDRGYVSKIIRKIKAERQKRYTGADYQARIAELQDRTDVVIGQMWKILYNPKNSDKARVMAGKVILDADKSLLDAQMDAGIFDRKLGSVAVDHNHEHTVKLPDEIRLPILRAFRNYGLIKHVNATVVPDTAGADRGGNLLTA